MRPVIFLNGPPYAGKDTLGVHLADIYPGFVVVKYAQILKEKTHALYGRADLPHDLFETCKDTPNEFFLGLTPRQAYINVSERLLKPVHGEHIFGEFLLHKLIDELSHARGFIITDSGFETEAVPLLHHFGFRNCLLVRIYAEGRGCSFRNDSRRYLTLPIETVEVHNNADQESFLTQGAKAISRFLQPMLAGECL